ncbi:TPA: tape measure protein, partial [Enterococcus faecium]
MAADATINIDVMLSNLPNFKNDASFVDDVLTKLGMNTGSKMDDSFKNETTKIETIAKSTKKDVDNTFDNPVKFTIKADNSDAEKDVKETKAFLKDIPKSKITELKADNDGASLKIKATKEGISEIPKQKETILNADATQAKSETKELGETAERTESKYMSLKDKLSIGAIAGVASSAIQVITGSFSDLVGEAIESSDAIDKFRSTMKLGKFGDEEISKAAKEVKKYANETVYDLSTISNTTAQLAANGVKNFTEVTEAAGNLNAQAGGNADNFKAVALAMTQTVGAGKLTTDNWNQIADAMQGASGVLQEAMKKNGAYTGNFRDAMEKGEISADEFNKAIVELGMTDGAIKAAKSVETFEGAIGNLRAGIVTGLDDIIKHLGKDKLTGIINGASGSVVGLFQHVSDVFSYLDKNKSTIGNITGNVKDLAKALVSGAWEQGKDILLAVADMFGLIDDNTKKIKDPLKQVDKIIENLADNKDKVELLGKALVTMFAVKKGFEFISMINQARKSLLEFTAVEKATSFLGGGGFSFGKKASTKNIGNVGAEIAETILPKGGKGVATIADDALESVSKLGGLAKLSKGVSKALPFAGVLASATELLGKGSASSKLGAFGGSLGGSAAGAAIGTAILPGIGTAIGAGLGGLGGTELGKKLGKHIGKGFKSYAPNLTNFLGDIGHDITKKFSKNVGSNAKELSKTYTKEMEKLNKIAVKTPKGDKELKKQKAQTTEIFKNMSDSIQK